jgi:hypothetical protein
VELAVEHEELAELDVGLDALLDLLHVRDLVVGQLGQALGQGERLEALAHPVDDVDLPHAQQGDAGALVRGVLGEALGLQDPERLPDRQSAGPEPGRDLLLPDPLPGRDLAGEDLFPQPVGDPLAGRADHPVRQLCHANASGVRKKALPSG